MKIQILGKALAVAGLAGLLLLGTGRADAALIVIAPTVTAAPGGGGTFNVTLQNTGPSAVSIGGFSFGISTTNPGIMFSMADIFTNPAYIFGNDSLFGPTISTTTGTSLVASDNPNSVAAYSVASGSIVGLGRVTYTIANNAALGPYAITLDPNATSLATGNGENIPITALVNGSITVLATPEPSSLGLGGLLMLSAGLIVRRRRSLQ